MTSAKCALLLVVVLTLCARLRAAEPVAQIMGRQIGLKEISPPTKELARQKGKLSTKKLAEWLADYRHEQLAGLIWEPLRDDFCKDHNCKATAKEIDEFTRAMRNGMEEEVAEWRKDLREITAKLKSSSLTQSERSKVLVEKRVTEKCLANASSDGKEGSAEDREAERSVHRVVVEEWKFNRALHRKYGGRIIFQQAGIEPLDAYRQFLEEHEKKGSFEIFDPALRKEFWKYYTTMPHTYLDPGDANFDTPWWKQKRKTED